MLKEVNRYETNSIFTPQVDRTRLNNYLHNLLTVQEQVFLLPKTGFDVTGEIQSFLDLYTNDRVENKDFEETKEKFIKVARQNIAGFYIEYLQRKLVLPISLAISEDGNDKRIICPRYNNINWRDITSKDEREGSVLNAVVITEKILLDAPEGTLAYIVSPKGWSGFKEPHPDTQIYVFQKTKDGTLDSVTIRCGLNIEGCRQLTGVPKTGSEKEDIKNIVSMPAFISKDRAKQGVKVVAEALQKISHSEYVLYTDKEKKTFQELYKEIDERKKTEEHLEELDQTIKDVLEELEATLRQKVTGVDDESVRQLVIAMGNAIHNMANALNSANEDHANNPKHIDYASTLDYLQTLGGCNGGGYSPQPVSSLSYAGHLGILLNRRIVKECPYCHTKINKVLERGYVCKGINKKTGKICNEEYLKIC